MNSSIVVEYLKSLNELYNITIFDEIKENQKISVGFNLGKILVDNINLDRKYFPNLEKGKISVSKINSKWKTPTNPKDFVYDKFPHKKVLTLEESLKSGEAICVQRALIAQLQGQRGDELCFYVDGFFSSTGKVTFIIEEGHAFNVVVRNGLAYIIDTQNPFIAKNGLVTPYIKKIIGIDEDESELILDDKDTNRKYYVN